MNNEKLLNELLELFQVKKNPVVSFWFITTESLKHNNADFPVDFSSYKLLDIKKDKYSIEWQCYGKKEVNGCFSKKYWHI